MGSARLGVSLLDLFDLPPDAQTLLPQEMAAQLELLTVIDYSSSTSDNAFVYNGVFQSLGDSFALTGLRDWLVELPGLHTGIPFQLIIRRRSVENPTIESPFDLPPDDFQLDMVLDRVAIKVPGLKPAIVQETPGAPTRLVRDRAREDQNVRLVGSATFRIESADGQFFFKFVSNPDPLDPDAPTGMVFGLTFDPVSFFIGDSLFGMTVDRLLFDGSEDYTPPEIVARGQPPEWVGLSIRDVTMYMPPTWDYLSIGTRDVLLGIPVGLQGKIIVEFGHVAIETLTAHFVNTEDDSELRPDASENGQIRTIQIDGETEIRGVSTEPTAPDLTRPSGQTYRPYWDLPAPSSDEGRTSHQGLGTLPFTVNVGDSVRFQGREMQGDTVVNQYPELIFNFEADESSGGSGGTGSTNNEPAPLINMTHTPSGGSPENFSNVIHITGPADQLQNLTFNAADVTGDVPHLQWLIHSSGADVNQNTGATTSASLPTALGDHYLILRNNNSEKSRRLRIQVTEDAPLLVGTESGVYNLGGTRQEISGVGAQYALDIFHAEGRRSTVSGAQPTITGDNITVAENRIAETILAPVPALPPPPEPRHVRRVTIDNYEVGKSDMPPARLSDLDGVRVALAVSDTFVFCVGRTDHVWRFPDGANEEELNRKLADSRALTAAEELLSDSSLASRVFWRGEQSSGWSGGTPDSDVESALPATATDETWLIEDELPQPQWGNYNPAYRRVDFYIVGPQPTQTQPTEPGSRIVWMPGPEATTTPTPTPRDQAQASPGYRVRLTVEWDSPTIISASDAIPTLAELLIEIQGDEITLPSSVSSSVPLTGNEIYQILIRWTYDNRTGETLASIAVRSLNDPDGLFPVIENSALAAAMAFAPAFIPLLNVDPGLGFVTFVAMIVASGFLSQVPSEESPMISQGKVAILAIAGEVKVGNELPESTQVRTSLMIDYRAEIGINVGIDGLIRIRTEENKPIKMKYKNVGLELVFDDGLESVGGTYEGTDLEVIDPGVWVVEGPLGNLLRIREARTPGTNGPYCEFVLEFALDLGIVTITSAVVRITMPQDATGDFGVELRGLGAKVEIPDTLIGEGFLALKDGGLSASLALQIIPAKIEATGALELQTVPDEARGDEFTYVLIELSLILPAGLPLGGTGLALFGFIGRFVANGSRTLPSGIEDPIEQEIRWHALPADDKYAPDRDQWAIGLGAVVGTMPDSGFSFNAIGMFTIAFPKLSVVFSIDAKFASTPSAASEQRDEPSGSEMSLSLLGLVAIDETAVKIGIRGEFTIKDVLVLKVPISGYFPIKGTPAANDAYVRIGSDGVTPPVDHGQTRFGDPVTLILLPSSLNFRVWNYIMFEEKFLYHLGGEEDFSFQGFSIGFGAGFTIDWSAGPIRLYATAKILLGMGTKPLLLVGGIFIRGGLSLIILTLEVSASLVFKIREEEQRLYGEICGRVSLFFFSIEGCVGVEIGTSPGADVPPPDLLCPKVDLADRRGTVTGTAEATTTNTIPTDNVPIVWPDTVPVITFLHNVIQELVPEAHFAPVGTPGADPQWMGTSELKYAYRFVNVELWKWNGSGWDAAGSALPAGWWWPHHRPGVIGELDGTEDGAPTASEHEGRQLGLLTWHPSPMSRNLLDGGASSDGDPAGTIDRLCEPTPDLDPVCVYGGSARQLEYGKVKLSPAIPLDPPYFDRFDIYGNETPEGFGVGSLGRLVDELGLYLLAGERVHIPHPLVEGGAYRLMSAYRYGRFFSTLHFDAQYSPRVLRANLILALDSQRLEPEDPFTCVTFSPNDSGPATTIMVDGVEFSSANTMTIDLPPDSRAPGIVIDSEVIITLPESASLLTVDLASIDPTVGSFEFALINDIGTTVAEFSERAGAPLDSITAAHAGTRYRQIVIKAEGAFLLSKLCYGNEIDMQDEINEFPEMFDDRLREGEFGDIFPESEGSFPRVVGIRPDGVEVPWGPRIVDTFANYSFVQYDPPAAEDIWIGFRIFPFREGPVLLVRSCANTEQAVRQQEEDAANRNDFIVTLEDEALLDNHRLLDPDSTYQVRVHYQWQGWIRSDEVPDPPAINPDHWSSTETQFFTFQTAPHMPNLPSEPPVAFHDESIFDPRAAVRYFLGFDVLERFQFYEDPLAAHFKVKYLSELFAKYGYRMELQIRQTKLEAGSRVPPPGGLPLLPPTIPISLEWGPLPMPLLEPSDRNMRQAAQDSECIEDIPIGGVTGTISADLLPHSEYDALLLAIDEGSDEELVVSRFHFGTSRYPTPEAMLAAMGFGSVSEPSLRHPLDVVVTGSIPAGELFNDADLESALEALDLTPWRLATEPRTILLWQRSGTVFSLQGVFIETDEPLYRTIPMEGIERLSLDQIQLRANGGFSVNLRPTLSDESGTRIMLTSTGAGSSDLQHTTLSLQTNLHMVMELQSLSTTLEGAVYIAGAPLAILEEEVA